MVRGKGMGPAFYRQQQYNGFLSGIFPKQAQKVLHGAFIGSVFEVYGPPVHQDLSLHPCSCTCLPFVILAVPSHLASYQPEPYIYSTLLSHIFLHPSIDMHRFGAASVVSTRAQRHFATYRKLTFIYLP